jgi:hypothetical protein
MGKQAPAPPTAQAGLKLPPPPSPLTKSGAPVDPADVAWATKYGQGGDKPAAPTSSAPSAAPSKDNATIDAALKASDAGKPVTSRSLRIR